MTEALINLGETILFLAGVCVCLSLIAWIVSIIAYIIYISKEQ